MVRMQNNFHSMMTEGGIVRGCLLAIIRPKAEVYLITSEQGTVIASKYKSYCLLCNVTGLDRLSSSFPLFFTGLVGYSFTITTVQNKLESYMICSHSENICRPVCRHLSLFRVSSVAYFKRCCTVTRTIPGSNFSSN